MTGCLSLALIVLKKWGTWCWKLENTLFCCDGFREGCNEQIITFEHQAYVLCKLLYIWLQISIRRSALRGKPWILARREGSLRMLDSWDKKVSSFLKNTKKEQEHVLEHEHNKKNSNYSRNNDTFVIPAWVLNSTGKNYLLFLFHTDSFWAQQT